MSDIEDQNENMIPDDEEARIGMDEIDNFDFDRAVHLMTVIEKCATVGVKATSISGIAQAALNEMAENAKDIAKRRADEFRKAEVEAARKVADEQRAREEAKAAEAEEAQQVNLHPQPPVAPVAPRAIPNRPAPAPDNGRRL